MALLRSGRPTRHRVGPTTEPYVRISRIRLFEKSLITAGGDRNPPGRHREGCYRGTLGNWIVPLASSGSGRVARLGVRFRFPHLPLPLSATPFAPRSLLGSPLIRRGLNSRCRSSSACADMQSTSCGRATGPPKFMNVLLRTCRSLRPRWPKTDSPLTPVPLPPSPYYPAGRRPHFNCFGVKPIHLTDSACSLERHPL